jgi:hypothetical protein
MNNIIDGGWEGGVFLELVKLVNVVLVSNRFSVWVLHILIIVTFMNNAIIVVVILGWTIIEYFFSAETPDCTSRVTTVTGR